MPDDDVRVRFERLAAGMGFYPLKADENGIYYDHHTHGAFEFYRAASGEVRELVEKARSLHELVCDGEEHGGDAFDESCPLCIAGKELEAALAKFTQEKNDVLP